MKNIDTYENSLRFCRTFYGVLALVGFLTRNIWVTAGCGLIMIIGVIHPNKTNLLYQFHKRFLRAKESKPIPRPVGELRFACLLGGIVLVISSLSVWLGFLPEVAWVLVLVLSFLMLLSGFSGLCAATLLYIFLIKKRFGLKQEKEKSFDSQLGDSNFVNANCLVARSIEAPPWERCRYCRMRFRKCPMLKFLLLTISFAASGFIFSFLVNREIFWKSYEILIFALVFMAVSFGYLFNKNTVEVVKKEKHAQEFLRKKVKERTSQLEKEQEKLEERVEKRTKELQDKLEDLRKFKKAVVGRELKMVELKKENEDLKRKLEEKN